MLRILFALMVSNSLPWTSKCEDETAFKDYRLPKDVVPIHYGIEIKPYMADPNFLFRGNVKMILLCNADTNRLIFHSKGLDFDKSNVTIRGFRPSKPVGTGKLDFDDKNGFVIIQLLESLKTGCYYMLTITYEGRMQYVAEGLYISSYYDEDDQMHRYVASTQFQQTLARLVFPCFDEPPFKATFNITIVRWKNMTSMSNMPRVKVEDRGRDWEADVYATSMKMSTYLVAFIVGKYVGKSSGKISVWTPKGQKGSSDFALGASVKLLKFYENVLKIPYDAPKLDMVVVPFHAAAAMENWGLVTYSSKYLLIDEGKRNPLYKKRIAATVAHETAHQWFGNLVTMEWWSDLWLNEGISSYMEKLGTKHSFPELTKAQQVVIDASNFVEDDCCLSKTSYRQPRNIQMNYNDVSVANWSNLFTLASDESSYEYELLSEYCYHHTLSRTSHFSAAYDRNGATTALKDISTILSSTAFKREVFKFCSRIRINSRANFFSANCGDEARFKSTVKKNVNTSNVGDDIFDRLVYQKGAIIVGMVHHILGEQAFWKCMRAYLRENAYRNVEENDFWRYVAEAQFHTKNRKISMKRMKSWTHLPGMPIVTVRRNYTERKAILSQSSCRSSDKHKNDLWQIPISYITQTESSRKSVIREWLVAKTVTLRNMPSEDQWILLNDEGVDYYVADYDKHNWNLLANQLKTNHLVFTATQRYRILADANHLYRMKTGTVTIPLLLELNSYLHKENSSFVFDKPNHDFLFSAFPLMVHSPDFELWKAYFEHIFGHIYDTFVDDESDRSPIRELKWMDDDLLHLAEVKKCIGVIQNGIKERLSSRNTPLPAALVLTMLHYARIYYIDKPQCTMMDLENALCFFGYAPCVKKSKDEFGRWKKKAMKLRHDCLLQSRERLCAAVRGSSREAWKLYEVYRNDNESLYLDALFCSSNDTVIDRLMKDFSQRNPEMLLSHGKTLVTNKRHWTKIFDHIDKHFLTFAENRQHFKEVLELFEYGLSPVLIEKAINIAKKHLPKLQGQQKEELHEVLEGREKYLNKFKPIVSSIEEWLQRKSWIL